MCVCVCVNFLMGWCGYEKVNSKLHLSKLATILIPTCNFTERYAVTTTVYPRAHIGMHVLHVKCFTKDTQSSE